MKLQYLTFIVLGIVIILTAAWGIPKAVIANNVDAFEGERKVFAMYALKASEQLIGGSLEPLILVAFKVEKIVEVEEPDQHRQTQECGEEPYVVDNEYEATVRGYTLFGLPYTTIRVTCTGAGRLVR